MHKNINQYYGIGSPLKIISNLKIDLDNDLNTVIIKIGLIYHSKSISN